MPADVIERTRAIAPPAGPAKRSNAWPALLKLAPGLALIGMVFGIPLAWLLRMSFNIALPGGGLAQGFTLDSYASFLGSAFDLALIGRTLVLGIVVTAAAFLLGYPLALFLLRTQSHWKGTLMVLALAPLLTSAVVRTFGWMVILGDHGIVNETLMALHLTAAPVKLANNEVGVTIALVEILLPYMILSVTTGSSRLSDAVLEASATLGGNPVQTFFRVVLPLTLPGVLTGCLLVFVLTISSFITPALVGGGRVFTMATEIFDQAVNSLNWPLASAISFILMLLFAGVLVGYQRLMDRMNWSGQ
jgi:putative spermidine/putrescine transport system permease protein